MLTFTENALERSGGSAIRPRVEHSYYVAKRAKNWVGYWYTRHGDRRVKYQRVICPQKGVTKTAVAERHAAWVREHVPAFGAMPDKPILQTIWERHIATCRDKLAKGKLHPKYVGTLASLWKYLEPLASREVNTISVAEVEHLFDHANSKRTGAPLSSESKGHLRNLARVLFRMGGSTAIKDAGMRFTGRAKGETLSVEQVRAIRSRMKTDRDMAIFDTFIFTGLRAGEARRVALIHLQTPGILETPGTKTDLSGSPIPIPIDLYARLLQLPSLTVKDPLLFEQESHRTWLETVLQPAAKELKIDKLDTRMLRRTVLTLMRKQDKGAASRLARHADSSMLDTVYDNADLERVKVAQDRVFDEIVNGAQREQ